MSPRKQSKRKRFANLAKSWRTCLGFQVVNGVATYIDRNYQPIEPAKLPLHTRLVRMVFDNRAKERIIHPMAAKAVECDQPTKE